MEEAMIVKVRGIISYITLIVFLILLILSCATTGVNKYQPNIFSTKQELELGARFAKEIEVQSRLCAVQAVNRFIEELGQRLVNVSDRPDIPYHFKIIDEPDQINAFALPGGYVYVYTGLLKQADSEAEVAGVLAHEIGHVVARHATERLTLLYGYRLGVSLLLGDDPSEIKKLMANLFGTGGLLAYSRQNEYEADKLGVKYVVRAGYDPKGMLQFFQKLKILQQHEPSKLEQLLSTHPPISERIKRVKELIQQSRTTNGKMGRVKYQMIKSLIP